MTGASHQADPHLTFPSCHPPDDAFASLSSFFSLPEETKRKIYSDHSPAAKGYSFLPGSDGVGHRRESFGLGTDYTDPEQHFIALPSPGSVAKNLWPEEAPELRRALYAYFQECFKFAQDLVRIFALACDLPEDGLDQYFQRPLTDITIQNYPKMDNMKGSVVTTPAHADYWSVPRLQPPSRDALKLTGSCSPPAFAACSRCSSRTTSLGSRSSTTTAFGSPFVRWATITS